MARKKLPIGIQTFRKIREGNFYYVDKTPYARQLVELGTHYFLSRPRRFGKSLFLDTLKELFECNEPLFRGLDIHAHWDWTTPSPVLRLDFGSGNFKEPGYLQTNLMAQLDAIESRNGLKGTQSSPVERFGDLIRALSEQTGAGIALLVDEYDKPILDALEAPEVAKANRDFLRGLYAAIKTQDAHIRFSFLTGVSKFSKVSLFSGLNNLDDITLRSKHAAICGYTDADLDNVFEPELEGLDRDAIRDWYNGYHWLGEHRVYNPFDILLLFSRRKFNAYWFETGTPTFLVRTLLSRGIGSISLDGMVSSGELLSSFDIQDIAPEALLFQTGYLTITEETNLSGKTLYRLGYPNREVRQSLNESLLRAMTPDPSQQGARDIQLHQLLMANDFPGLRAMFEAFFASIPHDWHRRNDIARYEGYYASLFYSHFAALGLDVTVEDASHLGQVDMALRFNDQIYLFEFKMVESAPQGTAMAQLKARGYADKHRGRGAPIHLIAVEFSREARNLVGFEVEAG